MHCKRVEVGLLLAIRDVWLLWRSKPSFIVIRINVMAPPGKWSSFFLLENILYLHSPVSWPGDSKYLILHLVEGEWPFLPSWQWEYRLDLTHPFAILYLSCWPRTGERGHGGRGDCILMLSVGVAATEPSKEWCVHMGHLPSPATSYWTEVGAEKLHSLLSACACPK